MPDVPGAVITAAPAYVLRQLDAGGRWYVVDRAGRSRLRDRENTPAARPGVDGLDPLAAMEASADRRAAWCEARHQRARMEAVERGEPPPPEPWIMFVAVAHDELTEHGVGSVRTHLTNQRRTG